MKSSKKTQNGITLIALVITIIVLLILAGVSISLVLGQNGVLTQAKQANTTYNLASAKEQANMRAAGYVSEYMEKKHVDKDTSVAGMKAGAYVAAQIDGDTDGDLVYSVSGNTVTITSSTTNQAIATGTIEDSGSITWSDAAAAVQYGLFDNSGTLVAGWDELVASPYYLNIQKDYTDSDYDTDNGSSGNSMYYVLSQFSAGSKLVIPSSYTTANAAVTGVASIDLEYLAAGSVSITKIGSYAFAYCSDLTTITIPSSVTTISEYAFYECDGLTSISIPASVTSIGSYGFAESSNLSTVTIKNSSCSVASNAFENTPYGDSLNSGSDSESNSGTGSTSSSSSNN